MKLSDKNLKVAIESLKSQVVILPETPCIFFNPNKRVLSSRYSGNGRPKKQDYDYVEDEELVNYIKSL